MIHDPKTPEPFPWGPMLVTAFAFAISLYTIVKYGGRRSAGSHRRERCRTRWITMTT